MNNKKLRTSLLHIIDNEPQSIKAFVAKQALQRSNIKGFFFSISKRGCISGMVEGLNFYEQTHQFFDFYYDEIEALRMGFEKQTGSAVSIKYDLKTSLSWFAFEQTANCMMNELEIVKVGAR
jgi:hypothetical protein